MLLVFSEHANPQSIFSQSAYGNSHTAQGGDSLTPVSIIQKYTIAIHLISKEVLINKDWQQDKPKESHEDNYGFLINGTAPLEYSFIRLAQSFNKV